MSLRIISKLISAKESVGISELEKLLEREKDAKSKGAEAVDALNVQVDKEYQEKQQEASEEVSVEEPDVSSDPSAEETPDTSEDDVSADAPEEETDAETPDEEPSEDDKSKEDKEPNKSDKPDKNTDKEEEKEEVPEESEKTPAKESFRLLRMNRVPVYIAKEDFTEPGVIQKAAGYVGEKTWAGLKYTASYLTDLGIQYGPGIASKLYHGVLFVAGKLAKLLVVGIERLVRYTYRHRNSYKTLNEKIESVKEIYARYTDVDPSYDTGYKYANEKVINDLKVGNQINIPKNLVNFTSFVKGTVVQLDKSMREEISKTKHMANLSSQTTASIVVADLHIDPTSNGIVKGGLSGYAEPSEYVESYVSPNTFCGDIRLIGYFPKSHIKDVEEMRKAYNSSKLFLGMDASGYKQIDQIPYLTREEVASSLEAVSILCGICLEHQQLYEKLLREKGMFKLMLKSYFNSLVSSKEKISLKDTSLELMYLKMMFVDKVYLPAAMDIHETCIKIINSTLTLCKESMKGWK